MHLKRNEVPVTWPVPRKGTKFLVLPMHDKKRGIPVLVLLRDVLKVAKTKKEAKRIVHENKVKVNEKQIKDEKYTLLLFDILGLGDKNYKLVLKNKKFGLEETKEDKKIAKIIGKKILDGGKVQFNLNDGRNFLSKEKINIGDSAVIELKNKKISRFIPLREGSEMIVIRGKHIGEEGKILKIEGKDAEVSLKKEKLNLKIKNIMAIK